MSDPHSLLGPYVLHALEDTERAEYERHLTGCPECAAEVAALRRSTTALAETSPEAPPAGLRARVLAAAAAIPQQSAAAGRPHRRRAWLAAAVLVLFAAAVGGLAWQQGGEDREMTAPEVLAAADTEVHRMPTERGTVEVGMSEEMGMVAVHGPELAGSGPMDYQLWWLTPDGPVSAGMLGDDMGAVLPMAEEGTLVMTMEPDGGSAEPTGQRLFEVPASAL